MEGGQPFDTPDDRDETQREISFQVGKGCSTSAPPQAYSLLIVTSGKTIVGLDMGILTMRKGETAEFVIAPELAFGDMGCPPRIPPNITVEYEVTLLEFSLHWDVR